MVLVILHSFSRQFSWGIQKNHHDYRKEKFLATLFGCLGSSRPHNSGIGLKKWYHFGCIEQEQLAVVRLKKTPRSQHAVTPQYKTSFFHPKIHNIVFTLTLRKKGVAKNGSSVSCVRIERNRLVHVKISSESGYVKTFLIKLHKVFTS